MSELHVEDCPCSWEHKESNREIKLVHWTQWKCSKKQNAAGKWDLEIQITFFFHRGGNLFFLWKSAPSGYYLHYGANLRIDQLYCTLTPQQHHLFRPYIKTRQFSPKTVPLCIHISHKNQGVITLQCLWTEVYLQLSRRWGCDLSWAGSSGEQEVIKRRALPSTKTANTRSIVLTAGGG